MDQRKFAFNIPTRIEYGAGVVESVGEEVKKFAGKKVLIVADKGIVKAGLVDKVKEPLERSGLEMIVFDLVEPNPKDKTVEKGAELAREQKIDVIIGVGGGSSMDTAKGIGLLVTNGGLIGDYWGWDTVGKPSLPLITIPTTAGTGSEVTIWAVIDDTSGEYVIKEAVGSQLICPRVTLVDPLLTTSLPPILTAETGMDALTHAIEAYTAIPASPLTDALALYSIGLIATNLGKAFANGDNLEARDNMMLGSLMAGIAFSNSDTAGVHCMAEAVGGLYDTPHGLSCAIFLPYVMEYNLIADQKKHADIAEAMGENIAGLSLREAALKSVVAVRNLMKEVGITPDARKLDVKEEDIPRLAKIAMTNVCVQDNPRKFRESDFVDIFRRAMCNVESEFKAK